MLGGFNSRSRVGSDKDDPADFFVRTVSIRAPAWGATNEVEAVGTSDDVSIRAPAWGATLRPVGGSNFGTFQFALPRGERRSRPPHRAAIRRFNSRSRVGSDTVSTSSAFVATCFNSRSRVGSDCSLWVEAGGVGGFNSRSRVGSDTRLRAGIRLLMGFNSRSRVGSDCFPQVHPVAPPVSIRAPAWGATGCHPKTVK